MIEITCRTSAAPEALARIKKAFPEMLVGAGPVVKPEHAKMCIDTGVSFGLAHGLNLDTIRYLREHNTLFIPGIMTPSEIEQGLALGCNLLKFFPAGAAGCVKFCPTGGMNLDNMNDYLSLPVVCAVGGSWLATKQQIAHKQWDVITTQVRVALEKAVTP